MNIEQILEDMRMPAGHVQINGGIKGHLLEGLVEIANGRLMRGLKLMFK